MRRKSSHPLSVSGLTEPVRLRQYIVFTDQYWKGGAQYLCFKCCLCKFGSIYGSDRNPLVCMPQAVSCWACKTVFHRNILIKVVTQLLTKYYFFLLHLSMQPYKGMPSLTYVLHVYFWIHKSLLFLQT